MEFHVNKRTSPHATSAPGRVIRPIAYAADRTPTCPTVLTPSIWNQRSILLLLSKVRAGAATSGPPRLPETTTLLLLLLLSPSFERTDDNKEADARGRTTRHRILGSIAATRCLRPPSEYPWILQRVHLNLTFDCRCGISVSWGGEFELDLSKIWIDFHRFDPVGWVYPLGVVRVGGCGLWVRVSGAKLDP